MGAYEQYLKKYASQRGITERHHRGGGGKTRLSTGCKSLLFRKGDKRAWRVSREREH